MRYVSCIPVYDYGELSILHPLPSESVAITCLTAVQPIEPTMEDFLDYPTKRMICPLYLSSTVTTTYAMQ